MNSFVALITVAIVLGFMTDAEAQTCPQGETYVCRPGPKKPVGRICKCEVSKDSQPRVDPGVPPTKK